MFGMQLSIIGGILLEQLMKLEFKSWRVSSILALRVRQWGGFMICVLFSTLSHISFCTSSFL
jgi:hypothetical protein